MKVMVMSVLIFFSINTFAYSAPYNKECDALVREYVQNVMLSQKAQAGWFDSIQAEYKKYSPVKIKSTKQQDRDSLSRFYLSAASDRLNQLTNYIAYNPTTCSTKETAEGIKYYTQEIKRNPKKFREFALPKVNNDICNYVTLYSSSLDSVPDCNN